MELLIGMDKGPGAMFGYYEGMGNKSENLRTAPLSEALIVAVARLVDDAGASRQPSHSDIGVRINEAGLAVADPNQNGQTVGKFKRVRDVLSWAFEHQPEAGGRFAYRLIAYIKGSGGFREGSPNFVGTDAILSAQDAFGAEGYHLSADGTLSPKVLDSLSGRELTQALRSYVERAKRGVADAALLTGTSKDLLEATAKHVLVETGSPVPRTNFPALLGLAFVALDMATPNHPIEAGEHPRMKIERALYELGCAANALRNREGTGHGRPCLPSLTDAEARASIEGIGIVAEYLLSRLEAR